MIPAGKTRCAAAWIDVTGGVKKLKMSFLTPGYSDLYYFVKVHFASNSTVPL